MKIESSYLHIFLKYVPFFVSVWVLGLNQKPGFVGRLILKVPKFKAYFHSCSMDRKENLKRLKSLHQGQFKSRRLDLYRIVTNRRASRLVTCLGYKHQQASLVCLFNKAH